jgi:hypothetical protein
MEPVSSEDIKLLFDNPEQEESPVIEQEVEEKVVVKIVNLGGNLGYHVSLSEDISSAELIFLIKYLKNQALQDLIKKELA